MSSVTKLSFAVLGFLLIAGLGVLVWQLAGLSPERYCRLVANEGDHCFQLLLEGLRIKGWTIWLLIGTIAATVLIALVGAVRAVVSIAGPNGLSLNINANADD